MRSRRTHTPYCAWFDKVTMSGRAMALWWHDRAIALWWHVVTCLRDAGPRCGREATEQPTRRCGGGPCGVYSFGNNPTEPPTQSTFLF